MPGILKIAGASAFSNLCPERGPLDQRTECLVVELGTGGVHSFSWESSRCH